jgi:hypothetical protein
MPKRYNPRLSWASNAVITFQQKSRALSSDITLVKTS